MIEKVEKTMLEHGMTGCGSILIGLSGGADSAALAHVLKRLSVKYGFTVSAAHVNHCLRGADADRDEDFSKRFAASLGIEIFSLRADVKGYAKEHGMSEEQAGRAVRYDYFERLMNENGIDCTATAHHRNDNAETIVMNFMRGSGMTGLCGIPYRRDRIIRPLLDVSRDEIERYCAENSIEYVTDATNFEELYTRNRIRHRLIPFIEKEFNPAFTETVTKNAAVISCEEDFIRGEAEGLYAEHVKDGAIETAVLNSLHPAMQLRIVRMMIDECCGTADVSSAVIRSVIKIAAENKTGTRADINRAAAASVGYGRLKIALRRRSAEGFAYRLSLGSGLYIPELGFTVHAERADQKKGDGEYFSIPGRLAEDIGGAELEIRSRRPGDSFVPSGMNGTKKLKDFMIDTKIPRDDRDSVGILTIDGKIAWVMGYRRDDRFKFKSFGIKIRISY